MDPLISPISLICPVLFVAAIGLFVIYCVVNPCGVGAHRWSEWHYEASGNCQQSRKCARCATTENRVAEHTWSTWKSVSGRQKIQVTQDRARVFKVLDEQFSDDDLRTFCAINGVDYDDLPADGQASRARELLLIFERTDQLEALATKVIGFKPGSRNQLLEKSMDIAMADAAEQCRQTRACERCGTSETSVNHTLGNSAYVHADRCEQIVQCSVCFEQITQPPKHDFPPTWEYESPTSCVEIRRCQRCQAIERSEKIKHRWEDWRYQSPTSCQLVRSCERCEALETGKIEHKPGEWAKTYLPEEKATCSRCGSLVTRVRNN